MQLRRASALLIVGAVFAAACSSTSVDERPVIEVFGTFRKADAQNFAATVEPFEEEHGVDVRYVGSGSFEHDIRQRIADADYPDVALFPQPALLAEFAAQGLVRPLPAETAAAQRAAYGEGVTATFDGDLYGVWFKAAVKSLVWYRSDTFAARGYEIPGSWSDLVQLTEQIEANGTTPWCLSMESFTQSGWVGTDWIEDIVLRQQGPDFYDDWVDGVVSFEDDAIVAALETFGDVVHTPGRVAGGVNRILNTPWQRAQDPMFDEEPGCLMHRQASFQEVHLPESAVLGENTNVFPLPNVDGSEPPVLVAGNLAAAFDDRSDVALLMEFLGTPEAGRVWASRGGFTSPHPDFQTEWYTSEFDRRIGEVLRQARTVRFDGSDLMTPAVGTGTFWSGMLTFVRTANARAAAAEIQAGYPVAEPFEE